VFQSLLSVDVSCIMAFANAEQKKLENGSKDPILLASNDASNERPKVEASSKISNSVKSPTKFGKGNPVRDAILLVSLLVFFIFISGEHEPTKKSKEDLDVPPPRTLLDKLKDLAMEAGQKRRKTLCNLFLYNGSIPGTGLSYFAGRDFEVGELLLEEFSSIPLENMFVSPTAFVLKHHPLLSNVQGVLYYAASDLGAPSSFQLRASQPISVGDELFAQYDAALHNRSIFRHIPSIADYDLTAEIVNDALRSIHDHKTRDGKHICSMTPVMKFMKQSIARFNPMVSTLLPSSSTASQRFRNLPPSVAVLRNQTLNNLQLSAFCLDDAPAGIDDVGRRATGLDISIEHGSLVVTLPVGPIKTATTDVCEIEQDAC
jgi:hypothetical protein